MSTGPILIVDDEPSNLATLRQVLGGDYSLVFARNGADALAAVHKHRPVLVLLDVDMPGMDGYAVCRQLKAMPETESVPVIFVSALAEVGDETRGFDSGGVDYIVKPISPALVRARVRNHLSLVRTSTLERYVHALEEERARVARLSRIRTVLSDINSAMLRLREPGELHKEACRILVEQGGLAAAWIVSRVPEGLCLTASQGLDEAQLATLRPLLDGPGLLWQCLAEARAHYCDALVAAASLDPVCRHALHLGLGSVAALPLLAESRAIGAIVLYGAGAEVFDDEERRLLNDLAADVSFALRHIEQEARVTYLSCYDALTGLPKESLFLDGLAQTLEMARQGGAQALVAMLDLLRFKHLNDTLGRHVGDQVLRQLAERLRGHAGQPMAVGRLGGDRFALVALLGAEDSVDAKLAPIDAGLTRPIEVGAASARLQASWGVAVYPADGRDAETLFRNAESALQQAKQGGERIAYYSPLLGARIAQKLETEAQLRTALEQQQFVVHYQPKVSLIHGGIVGAEALLRWEHPQRGTVPPNEFIPLAEETGLIVPIGEWVIRAVCEQQARWREQGLAIVPVAINLSALQFRRGRVLEVADELLDLNRLRPQDIEFELTETLVMHDMRIAETTMQALRGRGFQLSLDDFGTGYSSLAYLKQFPFNTVKVDRAFVRDMTRNNGDASIVKAIVGMAHSLHMDVVAEGVETLDQAQALREFDCDQLQGYLFSRPATAQGFEQQLRQQRRLDWQQ